MKTLQLYPQHVCIIRQLNPEKRKPQLAVRKTFIQKVQNIIEENIEDEDFGILELCKAIGISRSQLHNKIKAKTDLSTSIFIRNIRLQKAKVLLQYSELNISEVAFEVGFKDASYFSRLFTEKFGHSPSQLR